MREIPLQDAIAAIRECLLEARYEEAIARCHNVLAYFPESVDVHEALGEAYLERGMHAEAVASLERTLSADPETALAHVGLALILDSQGRQPDAIWHLERAFDLAPGNAQVRQELQRLYTRRDGVRGEGLKLTRGAMGRVYAHNRLYSQAIAEYQEVLRDDPSLPDARMGLAECLWREGRYPEAAQACLDLLSWYPSCLKANLILGQILMLNGQEEEAEKMLAVAQRLDPDNRVAAELMGEASPLPRQEVTLPQMGWAAAEEAPQVEQAAAPSVVVAGQETVQVPCADVAEAALPSVEAPTPEQGEAVALPGVEAEDRAAAAEETVQEAEPPAVRPPAPAQKEAIALLAPEAEVAPEPVEEAETRVEPPGVEPPAPEPQEVVAPQEAVAEEAAVPSAEIAEEEVPAVEPLPAWLLELGAEAGGREAREATAVEAATGEGPEVLPAGVATVEAPTPELAEAAAPFTEASMQTGAEAATQETEAGEAGVALPEATPALSAVEGAETVSAPQQEPPAWVRQLAESVAAPGAPPGAEALAPAFAEPAGLTEEQRAGRARILELQALLWAQPADYRARIELARRLVQQRDWEGALTQYEELIAMRKMIRGVLVDLQGLVGGEADQVQVYRLLGDTYMEQDQIEPALEMYRLARQLLRKR